MPTWKYIIHSIYKKNSRLTVWISAIRRSFVCWFCRGGCCGPSQITRPYFNKLPRFKRNFTGDFGKELVSPFWPIWEISRRDNKQVLRNLKDSEHSLFSRLFLFIFSLCLFAYIYRTIFLFVSRRRGPFFVSLTSGSFVRLLLPRVVLVCAAFLSFWRYFLNELPRGSCPLYPFDLPRRPTFQSRAHK